AGWNCSLKHRFTPQPEFSLCYRAATKLPSRDQRERLAGEQFCTGRGGSGGNAYPRRAQPLTREIILADFFPIRTLFYALDTIGVAYSVPIYSTLAHAAGRKGGAAPGNY